MTEHREYRVLRSGGRGGREPGILIASTRDRAYADRILSDFTPRYAHVEVWMETRLVTDWARLDCPRHRAFEEDPALARIDEFLRIVPIGRPHVGEGTISNVSGLGSITIADIRRAVELARGQA